MKKTQEIVDLTHKLLNASVQHERSRRDFGLGLSLRYSQLRVILTIAQYPDINITELATKMAISKSAVSKMTGNLQTKGLVLKRKGDSSNKDVLVRLTKTGEMVYRRYIEQYEHAIKYVENRLDQYTDEEKDTVIKFLNGFIRVLVEEY